MILLDTHALIWLASDQRKLSQKALKCIRVEGQSAAISMVTAWELALLHKRERLQLPLSPESYLDRALAHHRLSEIPISREIVLHAVELPDIHNDPFDRILIATAQLNGMPLVSKDQTIARYPDIDVVW